MRAHLSLAVPSLNLHSTAGTGLLKAMSLCVNTENQHPPPALAVVHVPAFLAPAEPCAVVGVPVVLASGPCNTKKTRQYNSCARTLDGLCAARPRWRGQAAPAALLPPPDRELFISNFLCLSEDYGRPRGAQSAEGCSGRTLAWRSQAKIFHYPSSACANNLQHVLKPGLGIVIHAHMECMTQEACLNGNGSGDVCKHKTNVHVGHTCLGHLHITICLTLLYLSRHEPFDHAWHKLRAHGNQPEHSARACAHAMDQLHQLELHMRMLQQAALAACND